MADSEFITAFNPSNDAFGAIAGEEFELIRGGNLGTYMAVSIDDLTADEKVNPGGLKSENSVLIFVNRDVILSTAVTKGAVLLVRGERVRVNHVINEGDNTALIQCGSVGIGLR